MLTRDAVAVTVTLAEEEARFLGGLVHAAVAADVLTDEQRRAALRIAKKFHAAGEAQIARIIEVLGSPEQAQAFAGRLIADHPTIEDVRL